MRENMMMTNNAIASSVAAIATSNVAQTEKS